MSEMWRVRRGDVNPNKARKQLKFLMKKYKGICQFCLKPIQPGMQTREHIKRLVDGGTSDMSNLTLACLGCNNSNNEIHHYAAMVPKWIQECIYRQSKGLPVVSPASDNTRNVAPAWPIVISKGIYGTIRRQARGVRLVGSPPKSVECSSRVTRKEKKFAST